MTEPSRERSSHELPTWARLARKTNQLLWQRYLRDREAIERDRREHEQEKYQRDKELLASLDSKLAVITGAARRVAQLPTREERLAAWVAETQLSEPSLYRHIKKLK